MALLSGSSVSAGEIEQLRSAVQHLMSENAEKVTKKYRPDLALMYSSIAFFQEQRIEQMRMLMERQILRNATAPTNGHASGRSKYPFGRLILALVTHNRSL